MKKENLKKLWGSYSKAAKALGRTKGAINQWNDVLTQKQIDEVFGAAHRTGVYKASLFPRSYWNRKPQKAA